VGWNIVGGGVNVTEHRIVGSNDTVKVPSIKHLHGARIHIGHVHWRAEPSASGGSGKDAVTNGDLGDLGVVKVHRHSVATEPIDAQDAINFARQLHDMKSDRLAPVPTGQGQTRLR
jgi:hypothetical protein